MKNTSVKNIFVKKNLTRSLLAGLPLSLALGIGFWLQQTPVLAQSAQTQSAQIQTQTKTDSAQASEAVSSRAASPGAASSSDAQTAEKNQAEQDENDQYLKSPNVVALGHKLGLNPEQASIAFTVMNFLLLAVGIGWLLVKFVPGVLRGRNAAIQKDLVDARTATEEARTRLSGVEERLGKLDGEIAALRTRSEQESAAEEKRIKATVEDEKKKILVSAELEIAAATTHAQKQLQKYAAELAIEQAARKLVVSAETDRLLVQDFAQRLTGDKSKEQN